MKPKDTVSFKAGTFGLVEPENLGIVLQLKKTGKKRQVELFTLKGKVTLSREKVSLKRLARFEGAITEENALRAHLKQMGENLGDLQALKGKTDENEHEITERALHRLLEKKGRLDQDALSLRELAKVWFHTEEPTAGQITRMERMSTTLKEEGSQYFGMVGRSWQPLTKEALQQNGVLAGRLRELITVFRTAYKRMESTDEKRSEEKAWRIYHEPVSKVPLTGEQEELLELLTPLLEGYIRHGKWPVEGPFGTGVAKAVGLDWRQALKSISKTQSGSPYNVDAAVKFLLWLGHWSPREAIGTLTARWSDSQEFPFELEYPGLLISLTRDLPGPEGMDLSDRTDLRHLTCYTIDPASAKDFDDAIGLETDPEGLEPGHTLLWVHIADVSHYVRPDSSLDGEAYKRATSVYLPDRVLPMLPPRLSDDLCSLRAGRDRLAVSVKLIVDERGKVMEAEPFRSVINVKENLSYPQALQRVQKGDEVLGPIFELAHRMRKPREGLRVESKERKVHLRQDSIELEWKPATAATAAIETFMVAANEGVARWLTERKTPLVYRCHDRPGRSAIEELNEVLRLAGLDLTVVVDMEEVERLQTEMEEQAEMVQSEAKGAGGLEATLAEMAGTMGGNISFKLPAGLANLMEASTDGDAVAKDYPSALELELARLYREALNKALSRLYRELPEDLKPVIVGLFLRSAKEAYYTSDNAGHFGLASACYCHFTSPIRRYPDLLVHRQIKAVLAGEGTTCSVEELAEMTDHCSDRSRQAASFEYRCIDICLALKAHLEGLQGKTLQGRVQSIIPGRVFLRLENGSEGALSTRSLGSQLEVDPSGALLLGPAREGPMANKFKDTHDQHYQTELTEPVMRLGDRLTLRVVGTDLYEGRLEVSMIK